MGWFTEVKNVINIGVPNDDSISWYINVDHGKVICNLVDSCRNDLHISIAKGDLIIRSDPGTLSFIGDPVKMVSKTKRKPRCFLIKPAKTEGTVINFDVKDGGVIIE